MRQYGYEPNASQKSRMDQATKMGQQALDPISSMMLPVRERTIMQKLGICFLVAIGSLTFETGRAQAADLQG
jgi:hypothetical protein